MKNKYIRVLSTAVLIFFISACGGETKEEKQARLQAYKDSLQSAQQAKIAEMMASVQDSIDAAIALSEMRALEKASGAEYGFSKDGSYVVQIGAWRSKAKAQSYVNSWCKRNYQNVFITKKGDESTGDVWYRVRIGYFSTLDNAENFGSELSTEINSSYWVVNKN